MDIKYDTILRPPESARGKILSRGRSPVRRATIAAPRQTGGGDPTSVTSLAGSSRSPGSLCPLSS